MLSLSIQAVSFTSHQLDAAWLKDLRGPKAFRAECDWILRLLGAYGPDSKLHLQGAFVKYFFEKKLVHCAMRSFDAVRSLQVIKVLAEDLYFFKTNRAISPEVYAEANITSNSVAHIDLAGVINQIRTKLKIIVQQYDSLDWKALNSDEALAAANSEDEFDGINAAKSAPAPTSVGSPVPMVLDSPEPPQQQQQSEEKQHQVSPPQGEEKKEEQPEEGSQEQSHALPLLPPPQQQ
jgi:hypothetical protein